MLGLPAAFKCHLGYNSITIILLGMRFALNHKNHEPLELWFKKNMRTLILKLFPKIANDKTFEILQMRFLQKNGSISDSIYDPLTSSKNQSV